MKKVLFALFALGLYSVGANAQDDVYFVPTKKAILKERQAEREAAARARTESSHTPITGNTAETDYNTWSDQYTGRTVDVDTYNRRGNLGDLGRRTGNRRGNVCCRHFGNHTCTHCTGGFT